MTTFLIKVEKVIASYKYEKCEQHHSFKWASTFFHIDRYAALVSQRIASKIYVYSYQYINRNAGEKDLAKRVCKTKNHLQADFKSLNCKGKISALRVINLYYKIHLNNHLRLLSTHT